VPLASGLAKTIDWFAAEHMSVEPGDRLGKRHSGRLSRRTGWSPAGTA
jgi:hypothetical protein